MLEIAIPGAERLCLTHLVADFNGTLALDGALLPGVAEGLTLLAERLAIHVVTADTFGTVRAALAGLPCQTVVLPAGRQDEAKLRHIESLGKDQCVCLGNGRNDRLMLAAAGLGIALLQGEGAAMDTLLAARIVAPNIGTALGLLINPTRVQATLRL